MTRSLTVLAALTLAAHLTAPSATPLAAQAADGETDWWKGEVCYEVFVRSFQDSDGDGVGDFRGLTQRLDYINDGDPATGDDLGAGCIWLMPISPSPSYHGYDITNYYFINPDYGTEADYHAFMEAAHARGIRVIYDLVLNHTSSEHPWFRDAAMDPDSPYRDWYVWADSAREMPGWQAPTWHRNPFDPDLWYFGLFWGGMPDLNLANEEVTAETKRIARFWLEEMGMDGLRLDAIAHLFERGGQWRHAPRNHPWLADFGAYIRELDPTAFTVGEVYDEELVGILPYYPDQLDSYFMFEAANAMIEAARDGSKAHLVAVVRRMEETIPGQRYSTLLRNHDQTRTMTELGGDWDRAALAATLLLTLPGNPFIYYGEEIGMTASKSRGDPRLRTPMHWAVEEGVGFTDGMPWEPLRPDSFTANVAVLEEDPSSLLNHYRRMIRLRQEAPALARGDFVNLYTDRDDVLAFLRRGGGQTVMVIVNLTDQRVTDLRLASPIHALEPGLYGMNTLRGDPLDGPPRADEDGRIQGYAPVRALGPYDVRIVELAR